MRRPFRSLRRLPAADAASIEAGEGQAGGTGAEGMVRAGQRRVDVEALGAGGAAP